MIYLDHAATTPLREEVLREMLPFFTGEASANASASYGAARQAREAIDRARAQIAAAIGALPGEIYFTSGGTEADNWALRGAATVFPEKKHIVVSSIEHHAVLHCAKALEAQGMEIGIIPVGADGIVSPVDAARVIRGDTALVSVMLANNEVGTIQPVAQIAAIAHERGALMHADAVQAVGHIPVDVRALGVDMLSMSAHKFYGPKGVGALFVRHGVHIGRLIAGGAQERGMRAGTENTPAIVGMGCALQLATQHLKEDGMKLSQMRDILMQEILRYILGARVNGSMENRLPGNLHMTLPGANAQMLLMQLDMAGIAASSGSACTSGAPERSHVIRAMGMAGENEADLRMTIGIENTAPQMLQAAREIARLVTG